MNISASCASSTIAIAQGAAMIALGRAEVVMICCMDLVTEFVFFRFFMPWGVVANTLPSV